MSNELLERHAELEALGDGDGGRFLSGWQCENPWGEEILARVEAERRNLKVITYNYLERENEIAEGISAFHLKADLRQPQAIFCGGGSTAVIFAICAWFRSKGVDEIFYIPPLYFTVHFACRLLGIRARAVSAKHVFESDFSYNLPAGKSVLFLCDPVWYAGVHVPIAIIDQVRDWQDRSGSTVFVDGSFQYMRWDGVLHEATAELDPYKTVRVICPTKIMALHGFRFAYAAVPSEIRTELIHTYNSIYGSASIDTIAFGRVSANNLDDRSLTDRLVHLASGRHRRLREAGKITAPWQPDSGYFCFEKILGPLPSGPLMDGSYFEQKRYPEFSRINLLSPSIGVLD